ncbi:MAG: sulfatase-like hydrolase/transferase [Planctomycetota bacterium]
MRNDPGPRQPRGVARRPNILFILTDQHTKRTAGFCGDDLARTPRLDRLAQTGTVFDRCYTTCPSCSPARASLQTGLYPFAHGMQTNLFMKGCMLHELADHPDLLSRRLLAADYRPLLTGKWHLGYGRAAREDPYYQQHYRDIDHHLYDVPLPAAYHNASGLPTDVGYTGDDFPGHGGGGHAYPQYQQYLADQGLQHELRPAGVSGCAEVTSSSESTIDHFLANRAIDLIGKPSAEDAPFFCMLNFWGPHHPAYVPTEFLEPFRDVAIDPPPSWDVDLEQRPRIHDVTRVQRSWSDFEEQLRYAYAYTSFIDYQIGRVLDHLDAIGELDHTWVIFSADHGDSQGVQAGLANKSFHFFESAVSVPLLIRPPGGADTPQHIDAPANLTDLYATVADIAQAPDPTTPRHGRSLVPWVNGEHPDDWPDAVVTEGSGLMHCLMSQRMYRHGQWKYVFNAGDMDELYDLDEDPGECVNLIAQDESHPELPRLRDGLHAWMRDHVDQLAFQFKALRLKPSCVST